MNSVDPVNDASMPWDGITVGVLLDSLGPDVVRPLALPHGPSVAIGSPSIHDTDQTHAELTDAVLLVPGRPSADLLGLAADAHVAAVVVRAGAVDPEPLTAAANRAGVTLLECSAELSWGQLYMLIDALRAVTGPVLEQDDRAADLFSLANDIALRAGGAVAIEDLSMRVLAYSTIPGQEVDDLRRDGILGRRVPDHPTNAEDYSAVLRTETAIWIRDQPDFRPRLAIAVRDGGEPLGSIWVIEGVKPVAAKASEVLAEGARLAAPHLARLNVAADADRRQRAERLGQLLRGTGPRRRFAESFGLHFDAAATVVVIGRDENPPTHSRGMSAASAAVHVSVLLRMALSSYRLPAAVGSLDGQMVAVIGTTADSPVLQSIIATVLARSAESVGVGWRAGISRTLGSVADVPAGFAQAKQALGVVSGPFGHGEIGQHQELGASLFLLEVFDALQSRSALDAEPLSLVADHDSRQGTDYVRTLRSWIAAHYDVARAAEALVLHPNTLRHRLRRMAKVVDIEDPDVRLALALQLRLQEINTELID
ncbi:PucR family transcriptional regulator [Arthrobacter sp. B2a2-09]|uniref:PucR family transcriptional regulator n=1 Tax=Arthrobacter sp. B2a2-09 TaxID=2952822 RepID=UPI0022CD999D|nr:helix-turn-helix domain-containing protein [Arthrobacter sp. B2a2-09]MCZ9883199.1 helix-turn-helix domain-containing protein [Arthrobacter sp. B2a2-09]